MYHRLVGMSPHVGVVSDHDLACGGSMGNYRISLGCPVAVRTLFQTHPSGSTFLRSEMAMEMGTWVK